MDKQDVMRANGIRSFVCNCDKLRVLNIASRERAVALIENDPYYDPLLPQLPIANLGQSN